MVHCWLLVHCGRDILLLNLEVTKFRSLSKSNHSPLLLIRWGASHVLFFFFFLQQANLIGPSLKKNETNEPMEAPKNRRLYFEVQSSNPFSHRNIGERRKAFANAYGIKVRCCWEHVGEYIGNLGNILGTQWEPGKNEKKILPRPKLKRKKSKATWVHAWAVPLAAWNSSSQKSLSPFLARPNTPYLFCFILISWGCLTSPTFFFHNEPIDWPIAKKNETMEAPQNRRFYGKMEYLHLWPTYIGEKGRTLGQT